jgi:hypothetical protein
MPLMAEPDPNRLEGASCVVTLDTAEGTLTFVHSGFTAFAEQKALSPVVVPLGAIKSVHYERKRFTGSFFVTLRGQQPWLHGVARDPHGVICGDDATEFAEAVKAAVASVTPLGDDDYEPPEVPEVPDTPPSRRSRFAKAAAGALVTGFFNTR